MRLTLLLLALIPAVLWAPIAAFFFANWRRRKNPISLATCNAVFACMSLPVLLAYFMGRVTNANLLAVISALDVVSAAVFYVAIYASRKFKDARQENYP